MLRFTNQYVSVQWLNAVEAHPFKRRAAGVGERTNQIGSVGREKEKLFICFDSITKRVNKFSMFCNKVNAKENRNSGVILCK